MKLSLPVIFCAVSLGCVWSTAYADKAKAQCEKAEQLRMEAVNRKDSDKYEGLNLAKASVREAEKCADKSTLAHSLMLTGVIYDNLQLYSDALDYYFKSLAVAEEIKDSDLLVKLCNHIGIIYSYQGSTRQALQYFTRVHDLVKDQGDPLTLAKAYNNLGICHKNLKEPDKAEEYYLKALAIFEEAKFEKGIISCYANIGVLCQEKGESNEALEWAQKVINLAIKSENNFAEAIGRINSAEILYFQGKYNEAITEYRKAYVIALQTGSLLQQRDVMEGLHKVYEKTNNHKEAFLTLKEYLRLKDTLFSEEASQKLMLSQKNYDMLKAEKEIELSKKNEELAKKENEILKKNNLLEEQELHRTRILFIFSAVFCVAVIIGAFVLMKRYREKKKANQLLSEQKEKIQQQKKEITDSINYARRIQEAMLPQAVFFRESLPGSFVLNRPKDIVSGDFYWIHPLKKNGITEEVVYAVADCTGHGVPGGFMSMLGTSFLNEIVNENKIEEPAEILNRLRDKVINALRQTGAEGENKDGMDITLVKINFSTLKLTYAAAHNPLWIVRKVPSDEWSAMSGEPLSRHPSLVTHHSSLKELKADKQPVAIYFRQKPFLQHEFQLQKGDLILASTDGYADQFGGPAGKKFKRARMKELVVQLSALPIDEVGKKLEQEFDAWKRYYEQNDDVCVVGVRV